MIVEFDLLGTHRGPLRGIPPTGKSFKCRMVALFVFQQDRIVCERVYFDSATILRQLGLAG
jgi:predicted ester cyclase